MLTMVVATFGNLGQAPRPVADFAFRLEYGVCTTDVLDTFQGVFVRDLGRDVPALSIPLTVSQPSIDVARQAIVAAHFFDYPTDFRSMPTGRCTTTPTANGGFTASCSGGASASAPADHYKLTVRNGDVTHTVSWQDSITPSTEQANRLRDMLRTIVEMIRGLPEVQQLPQARVACA